MSKWRNLLIRTLFSFMEAGALLSVRDYVFEDGKSKNKYFLVLKEIDNDQKIIISLPSSQDFMSSHEYD
ncbi:hypothetical protein ACYSNM_05765 [Myroides sp. LJL116]